MPSKMPTISKIGVIFLTCRRHLQRFILPHKITLKQYYVLNQLRKTDALNPSQIAVMLFCDRPTATVVINNMARQGWVRKEKDPENGKQVRIILTDEGKRKILEMAPYFSSPDSTVDPFACLTANEKEQLDRIIDKVYRNLRDASGEENLFLD